MLTGKFRNLRVRQSMAMGAVLALLLSSCSLPDGGSAEDARLIAVDKEPQNWLSTGRDPSETRHTPLRQVNPQTIGRLGLVWSYDLDTHRGQESTPLAVDGTLYTTSAWSKVQAFDALTGRLLWQFDPKVPGKAAVNACCDVVNRGAAYWGGMVFVGTIDGRLIAIDAKSGRQRWSVLTVDPSKPYSITGAPRVVKGRVIIGNGGAELGVRGYVSAYDARTGALSWRFYTVPGQPGQKDGAASDEVLTRVAERTWSGEWWKHGGGGGTAWDSFAYDPDLDLLYIGVGNGSFWPKNLRSPGDGDNLFLSSIVAVRPETGEYVWHYQLTPGDEWDYTATQQMILADIEIGGRKRKVLMQAPKNGFFYILDRTNGELLSAEPYSKVTWATHVDLKTGRPAVVPGARYDRTGKVWIGFPSQLGAHSWHPMSYDPSTSLVYLPMTITPGIWRTDPAFKPKPKGQNLGIYIGNDNLPADPATRAALRTSEGYLLAWDPRTHRAAWTVRKANATNGGVLSTAGGLVFQGDPDGQFAAYDSRTGRQLWRFDVGSAALAAPISYAVKGQQYVSIVVGWGTGIAMFGGQGAWGAKGPRINKSRVLTFALGGKAKLPPRETEAPPAIIDPPAPFGDARTIALGYSAYHRTCVSCHGGDAISGGGVPDLRRSGALGSQEAWTEIVANGILADAGMVGFADNFTPKEIEAIRAYVINRARTASQKP